MGMKPGGDSSKNLKQLGRAAADIDHRGGRGGRSPLADAKMPDLKRKPLLCDGKLEKSAKRWPDSNDGKHGRDPHKKENRNTPPLLLLAALAFCKRAGSLGC